MGSPKKRLQYLYDSRGNRRALVDQDGGRFTYTYDAVNRITEVINPQGDRTSFTYDAAGRRTLKRMANGTRASFSYDPAGNLSGLRIQDMGATNILPVPRTGNGSRRCPTCWVQDKWNNGSGIGLVLARRQWHPGVRDLQPREVGVHASQPGPGRFGATGRRLGVEFGSLVRMAAERGSGDSVDRVTRLAGTRRPATSCRSATPEQSSGATPRLPGLSPSLAPRAGVGGLKSSIRRLMELPAIVVAPIGPRGSHVFVTGLCWGGERLGDVNGGLTATARLSVRTAGRRV